MHAADVAHRAPIRDASARPPLNGCEPVSGETMTQLLVECKIPVINRLSSLALPAILLHQLDRNVE